MGYVMSARIGFCSDLFTPSAPVKTLAHPDETLIQFDSSRGLSFANATRNILILGQTGAGKTESAVVPGISALLAAGFGGIILDIKGNLRNAVRAAAAACGREDDIIEIGSAPNATPVNILSGVKPHVREELFMTLTNHGESKNSDHYYWTNKGGKSAADLAYIAAAIAHIAQHCHFSRQFTPTLQLVDAALCNFSLAQGMYVFFKAELNAMKKQYKDKVPQFLIDADHFCSSVESDTFHLFLSEESKSGRARSDHSEQVTWRLSNLVMRLSQIKNTRDIMRKFSSIGEDAIPLDFRQLVYKQRKIVLVHFSIDCGLPGEIISKIIKERYYQSVMQYGLNLPEGEYTFMVGDEFQEIVDANPTTRLNDKAFFGMSRQFHNINMIASQSVASLYDMGAKTAIAALLANCTHKILLQSSDPVTINWVSGFRPDASTLRTLQRGQCLVESLDEDGTVVSETDGLNTSYASVRDILEQAEKMGPRQYARRNVEAPYPVGPSGMPYVIEKMLIELAECRMDNKGHVNERGINLCHKLRDMRTRSANGEAYWDTETDNAPRI